MSDHIMSDKYKKIISDSFAKLIVFDQAFLNKKKYLKYCFGYIYLIREREFLLRNEDVYKIGHHIQNTPTIMLKRINDYKKGSQLLCACICSADKVKQIEKNLKKIFKNTFKRHEDGHEYFIGDPNQMLRIIYDNIKLDVMVDNNVKLTLDEPAKNTNIKNDKIICFDDDVNIDDFSKDNILDVLKGSAIKIILNLIKLVYFNNDIKKYHNIYSTSKGKIGTACVL